MARKTSDNSSTIVALAKNQAKQTSAGEPVKLSTGLGFAVFKPISTILITDAQSTVEDPPVPTWFNEDKGRDEENPNHPDYLRSVEQAAVKRFMRVIDAMVMFGMTLTDDEGTPVPLPENKTWIRKLQFLAKREVVDLDGFDLEDEFDLDFLYKRYLAISNAELAILTRMSGISEEDIIRAEESFPGSASRGANKQSKSK